MKMYFITVSIAICLGVFLLFTDEHSVAKTNVYIVDTPLVSTVNNHLKECPEYPFNQNNWKLVILHDETGYAGYIRYNCFSHVRQKLFTLNGASLIDIEHEKSNEYLWDEE